MIWRNSLHLLQPTECRQQLRMAKASALKNRMHASSAKASEAAFRFVLTMGVVNLFADATYEGGASINGPFLGSLGAKAAAISIIAGVGEFLGYSLRAVSDYIADRTGKHW